MSAALGMVPNGKIGNPARHFKRLVNIQEGEGNTGAAVGAVVAVGVFGAFVKGHSATVTNGQQLRAHTVEPITFAVPSNAAQVITAVPLAAPVAQPLAAPVAATVPAAVKALHLEVPLPQSGVRLH